MAQARDRETKALWGNGFIFPCAMWLLSRLLIAAAMLLIAPLLPAPPIGVVPKVGWSVFSAWDSTFYQIIATYGYEYVNDNKGHNVAFFPLFPLFIRGFMTLGLPPEVAGTLVNNLAFLGALIVLYLWVDKRHGRSSARWVTAALAWCPFSLFGTVIYTEGLFLLLSTAALRAFDKQQHTSAAIWGALATATRLPGIALTPAFLITAWRERRPPIAYAASLASGGGLFLYSLYCGIKFGDPLAFVRVQQAWQLPQDFHGQRWLKMLMQITVGTANWNYGGIKDPWHPLLFVLICVCGYLLWRSRKKLGSIKTGYGFCALIFVLWLFAGAPLINAAMVFGGGYLLWYSRSRISRVAVVYGFFSLALILSTGRPTSAERYAYAIVSLAIALGVLLAHYPRWGYAVMGFFTLLLTTFAIRFAQHQWVA